METLEAELANFSITLNILTISGLAFLLALTSETLWDVIRGHRKNLGETFVNASIGIVTALLERTFYSLIFVFGLWLATPFALLQIPNAWWVLPLAIFAADFTYYWMHRIEHETRILWANHSVHHSSPEYNFTTALRISWVDSLVEWVFFLPMILLGFSLAQTVTGLFVVLAYQSWVHTEKPGKLGWLDRVFNTPSVHRVHHGTNAQYIDKNYGGILIIWDRIFGTYEPEREKVVYGITTPVNTINPLKVVFIEYRNIWRDLKKARSGREALGYLFRRPGWRPGKPRK